MQDNWEKELHRVLWLLVVFAILGWAIGDVGLLLSFGCLIYISWSLWQLKRIHDWLIDDNNLDPPETIGFWGGVCDKIYHLQKDQRIIRARLEADIEYLRASFSSLSDAVVMINHEGMIDWCNDAAIRLLGLRNPADLGQHLLNFLREPDFVHYYEAGDFSEQSIISAPNNLHRTLSVQITRFGKGNQLLFARDITEILKLEQMRKDFVSNVSHELRTPLTVINGYIDNFFHFTDQLPALQKPLEQMAQNSKRMENLIRDLLELSRLETLRTETHKTQVSLGRLARQVVEEAKASLGEDEKREFELSVDDAIVVYGQHTELHSAFLNLVVNACKYTNDGGHIEVKCWKDPTGVYFSVEDDGIGLDPLEIPRLTERFYRADRSRSINTGGTGLGLAIVKRILHRHDAELEISGALGKGSTFVCHLPLHRIVNPDIDLAV